MKATLPVTTRKRKKRKKKRKKRTKKEFYGNLKIQRLPSFFFKAIAIEYMAHVQKLHVEGATWDHDPIPGWALGLALCLQYACYLSMILIVMYMYSNVHV